MTKQSVILIRITQTPLNCLNSAQLGLNRIANLAPHLEELEMLACWGWLRGCPGGWCRDTLGFVIFGKGAQQVSMHTATQEYMQL
jgi:hypothetical protein